MLADPFGHGFVDPAGLLIPGVGGPLVAAPELAAGPLAGFSFMEKYQSPAITTMHAPMSILRTSGVIFVSHCKSARRTRLLLLTPSSRVPSIGFLNRCST